MALVPSLTVATAGTAAPSGQRLGRPSRTSIIALTSDDRSLLRGVPVVARGGRHVRVTSQLVALRDERCLWCGQATEHGVVGRQVGIAVGVCPTIIAPGRPLVLSGPLHEQRD